MKIVYNDADMIKYIKIATKASPDHPILIDKFLEDAYEFDLDAISDGKETFIGGIMQHIEEAGIHSGDSSCVIPPFQLSTRIRTQMVDCTNKLCRRLNIETNLSACGKRTAYSRTVLQRSHSSGRTPKK